LLFVAGPGHHHPAVVGDQQHVELPIATAAKAEAQHLVGLGHEARADRPPGGLVAVLRVVAVEHPTDVALDALLLAGRALARARLERAALDRPAVPALLEAADRLGVGRAAGLELAQGQRLLVGDGLALALLLDPDLA